MFRSKTCLVWRLRYAVIVEENILKRKFDQKLTKSIFCPQKIFKINTFNYFVDKDDEVPVTINLDGLCSTLEQTFSYPHQPFIRWVKKKKMKKKKNRKRRRRRKQTLISLILYAHSHEEMIEIPELNEQLGTFIIEFIGNGVNSRALINKVCWLFSV